MVAWCVVEGGLGVGGDGFVAGVWVLVERWWLGQYARLLEAIEGDIAYLSCETRGLLAGLYGLDLPALEISVCTFHFVLSK